MTAGRVFDYEARDDAITEPVAAAPARTGNGGPYRKGVERRNEIVQAA